MFYPKHHCRSYCIYTGSMEIHGIKLDMGVYKAPDGSISHAIVYGEEDSQYYSGEIQYFESVQYKVNRILWNYFNEGEK